MTYKKLPKKFKEKWLKALRSGEYKQTKGVLCDAKGYCCLGVAGRSQGISEKALRARGCYDPTNWEWDNWSRIEKLIPEQLTGSLGAGTLVAKLAYMNDGSMGTKKKPFKQIANWIEKNL